MAKTTYKLCYYDWTGRGEVSRLIFALNDVQFEDVRIPFQGNIPLSNSAEWKDKATWGQVPILEVDGKKQALAQSSAINRFLARKFNLVGANDFESAKCDEYVDAIEEFISEWQKITQATDPAKQEEIKNHVFEKVVPKYFSVFNKILQQNNGKGLVGETLTWADVQLCHWARYYEEFFFCEYVKNYPAIEAFVDKFFARREVKEWMDNRPKHVELNIKTLNALLESLKVNPDGSKK